MSLTSLKDSFSTILNYKQDRCKQLHDEKQIDERLRATFESNQCNKDVFEYLMNVRKFNQTMGEQAQDSSIFNLQVLSTERLKRTDAFQLPLLQNGNDVCEHLKVLNNSFKMSNIK